MDALWAKALAWLQRRCEHAPEFVTADILEGERDPYRISWCRLCGAFRHRCDSPGVPEGWSTWEIPRPNWWIEWRPRIAGVGLLIVAVLLAGCAPPKKRPPVVVPTPPPVVTPTPEPAPPPVVECPTCCPADAPEATGYRWYQGNKANPEFKMVCAIAVTKSPDWCKAHFEDPRQHGTCSYFEECDPAKPDNGCEKRESCLKTKGRPTFTGPISVRADNIICGDVGVGETITACAPSGACDAYTVTP